MIEINPQRLMADLNALRSFGAEGRGVVRTAFSKADMDARRWLADRYRDAGLEAGIDGVGNVYGRAPACDKALVIGSHSDSQSTGGWLDGAMGVIYGLEIARAYIEAGNPYGGGIDAVSWMDEEGAYFSYLGSRSFSGEFSDAEWAGMATLQGGCLGDVLRDAKLDGTARIEFDRTRHLGYLEAHIEQGPYLERLGLKIGVVTGIVGIRDFTIAFEGQQNHAGTTPMAFRKDAGMAAIRTAYELDRIIAELASDTTVWTFGSMSFQPGAASIIPGRATINLQIRDSDAARLDAIVERICGFVSDVRAAGGVAVQLKPSDDWASPAPMDPAMIAHCVQAAESVAPGAWMEMPSGAGHDAQVLAGLLPCGMIFVPSIGGVSHDFSEDTAEEDIVLGCRTLAAAASSFLADAT